MFTKAIARTPGKSLVNGLTTAGLGRPGYEKALDQHRRYVAALQLCGLEVLTLPPDEFHPDATFIEDVALLTPNCAIIMNPGAPTRRGETAGMAAVLSEFYEHIETVQPPGTAEAGDIMRVGDHYYIGLSQRTNANGARQIIAILEKHGMSGSTVALQKVLHLKTGVAYLENNTLAACGEFLTTAAFQSFNILQIDPDESYAANCIWINGTVIVPMGYPKAQRTIENAGYPTIAVDVSEFRKLDGGLSCLSLRF